MNDSWVVDASEAATLDLSIGDMTGLNNEPFIAAAQKTRSIAGGMSGIVANAKALGIGAEGLLGPLEIIGAAAQVTAGGYQAYKGVKAAMAAYRASQAAAMSVEGAAAAANPFMWPQLALALGAMAAVYTTFQFASGEWDLGQADISSPASRDQAAAQVAVVSHG